MCPRNRSRWTQGRPRGNMNLVLTWLMSPGHSMVRLLLFGHSWPWLKRFQFWCLNPSGFPSHCVTTLLITPNDLPVGEANGHLSYFTPSFVWHWYWPPPSLTCVFLSFQETCILCFSSYFSWSCSQYPLLAPFCHLYLSVDVPPGLSFTLFSCHTFWATKILNCLGSLVGLSLMSSNSFEICAVEYSRH